MAGTLSLAGLFGLALILIAGCAEPEQTPPSTVTLGPPIIRVLIAESRSSVDVSSELPPYFTVGDDTASRKLAGDFPRPVKFALAPGGWVVGGIPVGTGHIRIEPAVASTVTVDGLALRGRLHLEPTGQTTFNVVDDLPLDAYLAGVLPRELFRNWLPETYKAQAVVARTYALYEMKAAPAGSTFDVFADQRSQMYGGASAETDKAREAVAATAGVVVAAGPPDHVRIFKAYFSACCGGIGQSAADAFGDSPSTELEAQSFGTLCAASPKYNWPPVTIAKVDLGNRLRAYAAAQHRPEIIRGGVVRVDLAADNAFGRPVKFAITDAARVQTIYSAEDFRRAVNASATATTRLPSSLFQIDNELTQIRFVNGHGSGHGVGMCQWCAQRRAELGQTYDQIVRISYPDSVLVRAY